MAGSISDLPLSIDFYVGFESVDLTTHFGYLMGAKEDSEINTIKKASLLSSDIFDKYLKVFFLSKEFFFTALWKISSENKHLISTEDYII